MPTPSASELPTPDPALIARFRGDLADLIDVATDRVVVAVSGGADSVALLLLTHAVLGARCSAATVDHGLRPAAAAEAEAVAGLCADRGIVHHILRGELPERVGGTANLSARARALRYRLLFAHLDTVGADWIATGHHADDQLETTLMRLGRGVGIGGLAGVRRTGWRTARPLLRWRRSELAGIVRAAGIEPVEDPTNVDDRFDRARMRKAIGDVGWIDPVRASASAAALADAEEALAWAVQQELTRRTRETGDAVLLDVEGVPGEIVRRLFVACLRMIDPTAAPDGATVTRAIRALTEARPASVGRVLIRSGARWAFEAAPPRRAGTTSPA